MVAYAVPGVTGPLFPSVQILQIYHLLNSTIGLHIRGGNKYLSDFPEEAVREDGKIIVL